MITELIYIIYLIMKMLFRSGDIGATVREIEFKTDIFLFHSITDLLRKTLIVFMVIIRVSNFFLNLDP